MAEVTTAAMAEATTVAMAGSHNGNDAGDDSDGGR
jgi:hypothetical protein